jgi:hypothetical protein
MKKRNKIQFIKQLYAPINIQHDLTLDSITIFANNITGTKMLKTGNKLTEDEVSEYIKHFRDELVRCNDLDTEWNQTS